MTNQEVAKSLKNIRDLYPWGEDSYKTLDYAIRAVAELPKRRKEAKRWRAKAHKIAGESYEDGYLAGQKNITERFEGLIKSGISTDTPDDIEYVIGLLNELSSANPQEPKYCDRNICVSNEYNGIGCDECEVTKSQEPSNSEKPNNSQEPKTGQFTKWVALEYNKDAFAKLDCRKLAKLGIVRAKGDEWELVEPQESEVTDADSN